MGDAVRLRYRNGGLSLLASMRVIPLTSFVISFFLSPINRISGNIFPFIGLSQVWCALCSLSLSLLFLIAILRTLCLMRANLHYH